MSLSKEEIIQILKQNIKLSEEQLEDLLWSGYDPYNSAATAIHDGQQVKWSKPGVDPYPEIGIRVWFILAKYPNSIVLGECYQSGRYHYFQDDEKTEYAAYLVKYYTPVIIPQPPTEP